MKSKNPPIVFKKEYHTSVQQVWKALTNLSEMKKWYFENIPKFKPIIDFETCFVVKSDTRIFTHQWSVIEVIPYKKIAYSWKYLEYPGNGFVSFELFENNHKTKLTLTLTITEDFPSDIPEFKRESCEQGWSYFLSERLNDYLS